MTSGASLQTQVIQKAWQDPSFKAKLLSEPKAAIQEALGVILPDHIEIRAVEENSNEFYIVLPPNPSGVITADVKPNAVWGV
ncbi:hypothetical protein J2T12_000821 [Paenibacillus anaericanus]|uniref:NHLP leader peptide family RiPP precursor n=1 Tax=Paenibacillus TaxID=44249 RepID=UPI00278442E8|nr:NHLP leader peptide family RiPP precursor [Paenibacillus anaericanus]MDQ0087427.1 hypothetical protein [Paenibacillus anaericanus]